MVYWKIEWYNNWKKSDAKEDVDVVKVKNFDSERIQSHCDNG